MMTTTIPQHHLAFRASTITKIRVISACCCHRQMPLILMTSNACSFHLMTSRTTSWAGSSNAVPFVLPSSTPSILRSTIMDVLYADRCHAPVSEGTSKQHQTKPRSRRLFGSTTGACPYGELVMMAEAVLWRVLDIQTTSIWAEKEGISVAAFLALYSGQWSTSSAGLPAVSFTTALSPSTMEGSVTICDEYTMNPSNHASLSQM